MKLPFLDRDEELARLRRLLAREEGSLGVVYGRRRCGKSRLIQEALPDDRTVSYVCDERDSTLQRASLAATMSRLLPGFDRVTYPEWDALFSRWWGAAKKGHVLVLDEFPALVSVSPELPSILQKYVDHRSEAGAHLILAGSSQRMMQGLVLDHAAPLFGRAVEILKISPLPAYWISKALRLRERDAVEAVEAYSVWGGVPRYWELAADYPDRQSALRALVLSPLGSLHEEPKRLLMDDMRETTQASSILSLIGQGCHRISEIAGRLEKPTSSLSRPMERLMELELVRRERPFGVSPRTSKRSLYRIADPFLRCWYRFVEPNLSRLQSQSTELVVEDVERRFSQHAGEVWEELVRDSVLRSAVAGQTWMGAARWWGPGLDRTPQEIDLLAQSDEGDMLLAGEVKWEDSVDVARTWNELQAKVRNLPLARGRKVISRLWVKSFRGRERPRNVILPRQVLRALR